MNEMTATAHPLSPTDSYHADVAMGATVVSDTREPVAHHSASGDSGVSFRRVLSAEWFKLRTVRSNVVALGGAAAAAIGLGMLFSSLAGDGPDRFANDALALSLGGFDLAQLIIAILGVAVVAVEYQTGLIRNWFAAAPNRVHVLLAKVGVYSAATFVVTGVAAVIAFLAGQALLPDTVTALNLTDSGVWQAIAGTALYGAAIGAIGIGLGFILRSTAAGAGVVVGLLMLAPLLVGLLPTSISDPIGQILPSNAGSAISGLGNMGTELLSPGWGLAVLAGWVIATVGAAAVSVRRRDA